MRQAGPWPLLLAGSLAGRHGDNSEISSDILAPLADLIGLPLTVHLLPDLASGVATGDVVQSRLFNKFRRADGLRWVRHADEGGIRVICLKGLATAHLYYDEADLRTMSDADLLVSAADRDRLVAHFQAAGLEFHPAEARSPWGHISDASMLPLTDSEGASNVDLHTQPDAWPLHLGLSTAEVFAAARSMDTGAGTIWVPSTTHMLLLCATHAARDLFGPSTAKSIIDAALLLQQQGDQVDWAEFEERLRRGRVRKPVRAFLTMLDRLGADVRSVPVTLRDVGGAEFERAFDDYVALFPDDLSMLARARRELLLCAEPAVAMRRNGQRLRGLFRFG
ncbi:MAG: hypothetical protein HOK30_24555 [Rhodospirillaceae bacterium]|jgi:hypothetical protein|nr:hypothetical protein [Rhodospirillaceae bacterium]MBT5895389.1 hypothetical protein [Rhodospirillaceae bacterium]MBT6430863.1 hypothetical protein [Rhodospirillaceae bacterium]MBT7757679.1 hypothetical protein [Rhodospirillaceae bacterium]